MQFYLIYVMMLAAARNDPGAPLQGKNAIAVLSAAALVSLLWPTGLITSGFWPGSFLPLWHGFLLGVGAYWSWRNPTLFPCFAAFVITIAIFSILRGNAFSITCVLTACLLWVTAATSQIGKALRWPWLQFLGTISYSLYLTHNLIIGASFRLGYMLTGHTLLWEICWWVAALTTCILFAAAIWWLIERPSIRLARKVPLRNAREISVGVVVR